VSAPRRDDTSKQKPAQAKPVAKQAVAKVNAAQAARSAEEAKAKPAEVKSIEAAEPVKSSKLQSPKKAPASKAAPPAEPTPVAPAKLEVEVQAAVQKPVEPVPEPVAASVEAVVEPVDSPAPALVEVAPEPASAAAEMQAEAPAAPRFVPPMSRASPLPRPPAKPEVFQEGDHVVYPTHGVGKVERIVIEEIAGHKLELIHITFEENRMTLRVPVSKARSAGLRKLATRKLFEEALNVLKGRARIKRTMWSRRAQEYEAKINSGDPLAIAEVVRDLHRNAGQPDQSFSERQIYEAAMDRLAAELAALDKTDKVTAATKLSDFLKTV
jgi:CarD family transcriptional regulator